MKDITHAANRVLPHSIEPPDIETLPDGSLEVITTHVNADFDAVASMIAAGKLYPRATMVFPGSQEKNLRNFFIQSVIYLFNVARIKDIDPSKVKRLILVDTRQPDRIGPLQKILENKDLTIHVYDHHPDSPDDLKGKVEVVDEVGANASIMTEILAARHITITPEEATVLALGIYEDTGAFTFRSTTVRDYLAAAYLREKGADLNVVAEMISRELTADQVALLHELIDSAQIHTINGLDVAITQATTENYVDELAVLVHKMMDMQGYGALFALVNMENRTYMVARSRISQINVGEVANEMGGGGHPSASAATIKDLTLTQAIAKLLRVLTLVMGPVRTAGDIMAFPVISVGPDTPLTEARELFVRYDINVLLVTDSTGNVLGFVSRQNVSKALYHGLPGYPVSEFMTTEFSVVDPKATFQEIQNLVVDQKQRIVPVVEDGKAVGVVTRTDLLNILTSETNVPGVLVENGLDGKGRTKKVLSLMRERLPKPVVNLLADIGRIADRLEFGSYAVGGFVRDLLLRQDNLDIDIVIEGDAIRFAEVFAREHEGVRMRAHRKFKTAVLIFPEDFKVDVTTARLEYYEHPAALPVVEGGSIHMDLYRRDFTINALAVTLNEKKFGTVIDYFRGLKDLKDGYIRVLHNLSFVEDPTRVFRAIRFEQRFGFRIGKLTISLIQNAVKHDFFLKLSGKRLSNEIRPILQEDDPGPAVARMSEFDLLKFIHPGLSFDKKASDSFQRIKKVRHWFDLTFPNFDYQVWLLYIMALLNGLSRSEMTEVCGRLSLLKREKQILVDEKPHADRALGWLHKNRRAKPSKIHDMLHLLSVESILFMMGKTTAETTIHILAKYLTDMQYVRPELTGQDLIDMGFTPGPEFREILDAVQAARLNGEVQSRQDELDFVQRIFVSAKQ
jgi:tRNA nucleotidyltransferase (CCA-adding enzyme)